MAQEIKVTVVVPVYNVEKYLKQCLDSLLEQTVPINIIIVNDGSSDNSGEIAQTYAAKHAETITYIEQANAGLSAARNVGIKQTNTPYIAFMDSDDWVSHDYYEKLLITMEQNNADIVCSDITYIYENGKEKKKLAHNLPDHAPQTIIEASDKRYHRYMISIFPMAQNKLWKTALIKETFTFLSGKQYEDLDFFYRVYPNTQRIAFTTAGGFYYRQRAGSIVKTANNKILDIMPIFDNIVAYYKTNHLYEQYHMEIEYLLIRNCLVASSKRIAYSRNYRFIYSNLTKLFTYVSQNIPNWRQNAYIKPLTIRHLFIRSFAKATIGIYSFFLLLISIFL